MSKKVLIAIVGLVFALWQLAAPHEACGQGLTSPGKNLKSMVDSAKWRFGDLRINAALILDSLGYDSDIYYGFFGDPTPDFTLSTATPVQIILPVGRNIVLDVADSPEYLYYLKTERERAWNNMFRGRLHVVGDRFYFQAAGSLSNTRRRMSPEFSINIREKTKSLSGLLLWMTSRGTSLTLVYGTGVRDYGNAEFGGTDIGAMLNRKENHVDIIASVSSGTRIRTFLDGRYGAFSFTEEVSRFKDTKSYGILGGIEFIASGGRTTEEETLEASRVGEMRGSATLGYTRFDVLDPTRDDGDGFTGEGSLSLGIMRLTTAEVHYARSYEFSMYSGGTFFTHTAFGGAIARRMSRTLTLTYDLSFGRGKYPEILDGGGIPAGIYGRYTTHMLSLDLLLSRNMTLTVLGTLGRRLRTESGEASTRAFIGCGLVYGKSPATVSVPSGGMSF
jgi:hypothetical protein